MPSASHCSHFAGVKAKSSGEREMIVAQPAAFRTSVEGAVQQHTCTCFCATTWICSPHFVFPFSHPGNPYMHTLWGRSSIHIFSEERRFSSFFLSLQTVLLGNYFEMVLLFIIIKAKALSWKWSLNSWSTLVSGSNALTWWVQLSSLYKLLFLSYLSSYVCFFPIAKACDTKLAQIHHSRLIRSIRAERKYRR